MSVSGLKAELKFLESIFDKDHERFRIVSWKLDELHCQFVLLPPPPGSGPPPPPPLTIHCNITVRAGGSAPSRGARDDRGSGGGFRPPPPRGRSGCALPGPANKSSGAGGPPRAGTKGAGEPAGRGRAGCAGCCRAGRGPRVFVAACWRLAARRPSPIGAPRCAGGV